MVQKKRIKINSCNQFTQQRRPETCKYRLESITRAKWCSNKVVGPEAIQKNLIHSSSWCCWGWNFGWSVASWTHKKNMSGKFWFWTFQNARGNLLTRSELGERIHWSWRKPQKKSIFFWIRVISRLTSFKGLV